MKIRACIISTLALALVSVHAGAQVGAFSEGAGSHPDRLASEHDHLATSKAGPVTAAEVGDPDSFGRDVIYLGVAETDALQLVGDCTGVAGPCVEINPAPAFTNVDESGLASIELPANATNSLICFSVRPIAQWTWSNTTGSQQLATMALRPRVRIENPVLADPSVGLGGAIEFTLTTFIQQRTIEPGESDLQIHQTSRDCVGGLISKRNLQLGFGLTDRQVRDFFRGPTTITFGVVGQVAMVDSAVYFFGVRLYGD